MWTSPQVHLSSSDKFHSLSEGITVVLCCVKAMKQRRLSSMEIKVQLLQTVELSIMKQLTAGVNFQSSHWVRSSFAKTKV